MPGKIKWGIIGLGSIADLFAHDLLLSEKAILYGVASRDRTKAQAFSEKFDAITYFDSYEALAQSHEIDVIYIATPHAFHCEHTLLCLSNGKSVLCEKPLGMDSDEVTKMLREAQSRKLFLMEAIWTRFIPATEKLLELLRSDAIGEVQHIRADFGFEAPKNVEGRLYNKQLGGGSLLDIGIYPIFLSLLTLGIPTDIKAMARFTATEVDSYCSMLFDYENAAKANLECTIQADTPTEAFIYGTKGMIKMHTCFHQTEKISLYQHGVLKEEIDMQYTSNGYLFEIEEVHRCVINRELESTKLPHAFSLDLITVMDKVRALIGLRYKS